MLKFVKDVASALSDYNGAASNYQSTVDNLYTVQSILEELEELQVTAGTLPYVTAIRTQAQHLKGDIEALQKKAQKYNSKIGRQAPKGFYRGALQKMNGNCPAMTTRNLAVSLERDSGSFICCIVSVKGECQ